MLNVKINNLEFSIQPGISILDACKYVGVTVPRFCYHELLSVAGNCRMCLVEVEPFEKPVASCVAEIEDNMSVKIDTPFVKKARENVMEMLLLNHPLDCPICDQAGECDLQDQAKVFGNNFSRNTFYRKGVEDKYCGPLIKTIMTRCISCTRCVRYASEIAGIDYFGTLNRGGSTEIGNYVEKIFLSEISGNVIDLCPVGALTSKPYAFKSRPWELRTVESIDTLDSLHSGIYVNFKESEIFRILPRGNSYLNLNLISDKVRFSYDSNNCNRIDSLYEYNFSRSWYKKLNWDSFFKKIDGTLKKKDINIVLSSEIDLDSLLHLKKIFNKKNIKIVSSFIKPSISKSNVYVSNVYSLKKSIDSENNLVFFVGTSLRSENSIINVLLKIEQNKKSLTFLNFGSNYKENLSLSFVSISILKLLNSFEGRSDDISKYLSFFNQLLVIVGSSFYNRLKDKNFFFNKFLKLNLNLKVINLENESNSKGMEWSHLNFFKSRLTSDYIFGLNLNDNYQSRKVFCLKNKNNSVWINTHGSFVSSKAKYILPLKTNYESQGVFLNIDNKPQLSNPIFNDHFNSKTIKNTLASIFNIEFKKPLFVKHFTEESQTKNVVKEENFYYKKKISKNFLTKQTLISKYPLKFLVKDFYLTNNFTRNSKIMLESSEEFKLNGFNF